MLNKIVNYLLRESDKQLIDLDKAKNDPYTIQNVNKRLKELKDNVKSSYSTSTIKHRLAVIEYIEDLNSRLE
jgi:hypothetical protein